MAERKKRVKRNGHKQGTDNYEFEVAFQSNLKDLPEQPLINDQGKRYGTVKVVNGKATVMVLELPTTLIDLSAMENSMARMMLETINNMMIELYASMAQAEIEKKEKRQREGIEQKKARGEWDDYGRPRVMDLEEFATHYRLVQQGEKKPFKLMKELGMTKPTFYRYKNQIEKGC